MRHEWDDPVAVKVGGVQMASTTSCHRCGVLVHVSMAGSRTVTAVGGRLVNGSVLCPETCDEVAVLEVLES